MIEGMREQKFDLPEAIALGDRVMVMSARPGRAKVVLDVDIERPRDLSHIHELDNYRKLLSRLGDELAEEIQLARELQENANKKSAG